MINTTGNKRIRSSLVNFTSIAYRCPCASNPTSPPTTPARTAQKWVLHCQNHSQSIRRGSVSRKAITIFSAPTEVRIICTPTAGTISEATTRAQQCLVRGRFRDYLKTKQFTTRIHTDGMTYLRQMSSNLFPSHRPGLQNRHS